jgi:hypothetical protein
MRPAAQPAETVCHNSVLFICCLQILRHHHYTQTSATETEAILGDKYVKNNHYRPSGCQRTSLRYRCVPCERHSPLIVIKVASGRIHMLFTSLRPTWHTCTCVIRLRKGWTFDFRFRHISNGFIYKFWHLVSLPGYCRKLLKMHVALHKTNNGCTMQLLLVRVEATLMQDPGDCSSRFPRWNE